ncbi:hypothetical protein [Streptomyces sp. PvR034]|uniref:hypothetical protein n=1 Tax=Streptomyces sp. PvR034 TaxID=3156401 RepID=UPI003391FDD5
MSARGTRNADPVEDLTERGGVHGPHRSARSRHGAPVRERSGRGAGAAPATPTGAQAHVQQYTSCENLSTDPNDSRVPLSGFIGAGE